MKTDRTKSAWYKRFLKKRMVIHRQRVAKKLCTRCGSKRLHKGIQMCLRCKKMVAYVNRTPAQRSNHREWSRARRRELRTLALRKLGNKCKRCGIRDVRVLQIDHVKGGGKQERLRLRRSQWALCSLVLKDKTGKYQLLCANCNWIKRCENHEHDIPYSLRRAA